ncbi:MAG: FMN-binding protein [Planctomycetota bacterium]|jgi:Na+-translocating ferredoxin:NAD+ oxidoreductase RnfG subunit
MKAALPLLLAGSFLAGGSLTHEEALEQAFPKAELGSKTHYWSKEERSHLATQAGVKKVRGMHTAWTVKAKEGGRRAAGSQAWFDLRKVRSKAQDLMVVVDAQGKVVSVTVCRFDEPIDYRPSQKWYDQFVGETLDDELVVGKDIHAVSGATMTTRATTQAVREILAADALARHGLPKPEPKEGDARR